MPTGPSRSFVVGTSDAPSHATRSQAMALDRVRFVADAASMLGAIHPDVPVAVLSDALTDALGNELVGLYAYGLAVSGGFDPGVSDIDLVAVTAHPATALDFEALDHVHREFVRRHAAWENRLEIVYIGSADLRGFRASEADLAVISPGEPFHLSGPVSDWLQNWYLVRETERHPGGQDGGRRGAAD